MSFSVSHDGATSGVLVVEYLGHSQSPNDRPKADRVTGTIDSR